MMDSDELTIEYIRPGKDVIEYYEAHFNQHTVQIDNTLVAIGQAPTASKRPLRTFSLRSRRWKV